MATNGNKELMDLFERQIEHTQTLLLFFLSCPFPAWVKIYDVDSDNFFMLRTNDTYTKTFGIQVNAYIDKKDEEVWGKKTGGHFNKNDKEAVGSLKRPVLFEETFLNPKTNSEETWLGVKWSVIHKDSIYVFGVLRDKIR